MSYPTGDVIRHAREAQGWTMAEAARTLKQRYGPLLPDTDSLVRSWKRWEKGTAPSRFYRPLLSDLLGFDPADLSPAPASAQYPSAEIPQVFRNQEAAAPEIRAMAQGAGRIDVLAVRGLGLLALNDSLLHPALDGRGHDRPLYLRVLLLRPGTEAARRRAAEIGESIEAFDVGLELATARLHEIASVESVEVEVYRYEVLPVWRLIGIDETLTGPPSRSRGKVTSRRSTKWYRPAPGRSTEVSDGCSRTSSSTPLASSDLEQHGHRSRVEGPSPGP